MIGSPLGLYLCLRLPRDSGREGARDYPPFPSADI